MLPIISCEHASNRIPETLSHLFSSEDELLASHQGFDIGARQLAEFLSTSLEAPLHLAPYSRLVVDCNRSLGHPALFSMFTRPLPPLERETILFRHYHPYRQAVLQSVLDTVQQAGAALHIGVHSFTPVLHGKKRAADIGLLYDPARMPEKNICSWLSQSLNKKMPQFRTRCNYPYRGVSDGLIPTLRRSFLPERYIGIELELNQALYDRGKDCWSAHLVSKLGELLTELLTRFPQ